MECHLSAVDVTPVCAAETSCKMASGTCSNCQPCRKSHCLNYMETQPKVSPDDPQPSNTNSVSGQEESHNGENTQPLAEQPSSRSILTIFWKHFTNPESVCAITRKRFPTQEWLSHPWIHTASATNFLQVGQYGRWHILHLHWSMLWNRPLEASHL